MSAAVHSEPPYDPHQRLGDIQVGAAATDAPAEPRNTSHLPPPPAERALRIRVYAWCPEYGYHTDPELQAREGL